MGLLEVGSASVYRKDDWLFTIKPVARNALGQFNGLLAVHATQASTERMGSVGGILARGIRSSIGNEKLDARFFLRNIKHIIIWDFVQTKYKTQIDLMKKGHT